MSETRVSDDTDTILIVPCVERGRGGGHLVRSAVLTRSLREKGREAFLFIPNEENSNNSERIFTTLNLANAFDPSWICNAPPPETSFIIIDGFRTSQKEFEKWSSLAPVLGIDEGGSCRERFDFLVDLLPGILRRPNLTAPYFLPLPENKRSEFSFENEVLRMLICFGAEDAAGLGIHAARLFARLLAETEGIAEITLLGGMTPDGVPLNGVRHLNQLPELREYLTGYDLVITHFGITAFEALNARVPVVLVSPTPYHEKLARKAGFISAGSGRLAVDRLCSLLFSFNAENRQPQLNRAFLEELIVSCKKLAGKYTRHEDGALGTSSLQNASSLGEYLASAKLSVSRQSRCGCNEGQGGMLKVIARYPERTYRRCRKCGLISMDRLTAPPIEYDKDYFFDSYKKQYGKTYMEDFPALVEAGRRRLSNIKPILRKGSGSSKPKLLDIGCAYGPFLTAAKEEGFAPEGIEPAEDAARYVREELGIPCKQGFFPGNDTGVEFDAVTLWYVIEHFQNPGAVLDEIYRILKTGGVLAFSTPSFSGVSGRKSLDGFLKISPEDHWTVWNPKSCRKVLKKHGFALKKIVVTGHHPERFPLIGERLIKGGLIYRLCMALSRIFNLGDSFEAYAVKISSEPFLPN